jgi:hypothetical protein
MYASRTLTEHLVRGALSVLGLWAAVHWSHVAPWGLLVAFPAALVLWRGCPTCWLVGLGQTVTAVLQGKEPPPNICTDGSCAVRPEPPTT